MNRRPLKIALYIIAFLVVAAIITIAPVDRTPIVEQPFYQNMLGRIADASPAVDSGLLKTGWSRINITPEYPMPMAGYAPRNSFELVHDSLYARVLKVKANEPAVVFISLDLLLFPPSLRDRLTEKMDSVGLFDVLYLSATHTHNGVGGWDDSFVGRWSLGKFHEHWVESTANSLLDVLMTIDLKPGSIRYWQSDATELVENRVDRENGAKDGVLRGIELVREDSSKAILYTFSAHPTSIDRFSHDLSADYPGALSSKLEDEFDFAMFMAGMVGSHRFAWVPQANYEFIDYVTPILSEKISNRKRDSLLTSPRLRYLSMPIGFGPSQLRISENWKVRDWVFRSLLRPLKGNVVVAEIGNIMFIGLPCDFSGEIFSVDGLGQLAESRGKHVVITSFNGDYDGYITLDKHYDVSRAEEIRTLNWVGPGYGEYFSSIIKALVERRK